MAISTKELINQVFTSDLIKAAEGKQPDVIASSPDIQFKKDVSIPQSLATGFMGGATFGALDEPEAREQNPKSYTLGNILSYLVPGTGPSRVFKAAKNPAKITRGLLKTGPTTEKALQGALGAGGTSTAQSLVAGEEPDPTMETIIGMLAPVAMSKTADIVKGGGKKGAAYLLQKVVRPTTKSKERGLDLSQVGEKGQIGLNLKRTMDNLNNRFKELGKQRKQALSDVSDKKINIEAIESRIRERFNNPNDPLGNFDEKAAERALTNAMNTLKKFKVEDGLTDPVTAQDMAVQLFKKSMDIIKLGQVDEKAALKKVILGTLDREIRKELDKTGAKGIQAINKEFSQLLPAAEQIQRRLTQGDTETIPQAIRTGLLTGGTGAMSFYNTADPLQSIINALAVGAGSQALRGARIPTAKALSAIGRAPDKIPPTLKEAATRGAVGTGLTLEDIINGKY